MTARQTERGLTLVEVLVAAGLLSLVISAALAGLLGANQASERTRRVGDVQETARLALESIAADLRVAGMGAQLGVVGVAPSNGAVRRIPVVYAGPDQTVNDTFGGASSSMITNSIFIISGQPASGMLSSDGAGMIGTVVKAAPGNPPATPATVYVSCYAGPTANNVDCANAGTYGDYTLLMPLGSGYQPLLVGDFRNAVYLRPLTLSSPPAAPVAPEVGDPRQQLTFAEQSSPSFSPDPRAPFGFAPGAVLQRARVLHYYLWPAPNNAGYYELRRSQPILADNGGDGTCTGTDAPFIDETNSTTGPAGVSIGSGPVESLQIRYVADVGATDLPGNFSLVNVGVCDGATIPKLRELRVQVVARSLVPDKATDGTQRTQYSTPTFETAASDAGALPSNAAYVDPYPRRTFSVTVVPRNLQGIRL